MVGKNSSTKTSIKALRLRNDVIEKIQYLAQQDNRTFTNMVETILIREAQIDISTT